MASQAVQDTLKKMDQAMARLQEMQCTIVGGTKACGGVNLSPRSTRGYLRTSLRCKEESMRLKELAMKEVEETNPDKGQQFERVSSLRRSSSIGEESRRWSMPAVLIQQAVGEIMEASNFAKEVAYVVSSSNQNEVTESPSIPWISNGKALAVIQQQQNSDSKHVPDAIATQDLDTEGKSGLQKFWSNKPNNKVYKFRVRAKDASSSLKCLRDVEKQENPARGRAELPELGMRVRSKMSFQVSNGAKEQGGMDKLILSPPLCSPPAKTINEETTSADTEVKVEQIRPSRKGWISRCTSTRAIMFPNPAFVSSPSKNTPKDRSTDACMRRKSLPSLKDLTSSKTTASSPFYKEKEFGDCKMDSCQNLRKSSSFSEAYRHSAAKLIKQSHIPSLLSKAMKKFHLTKASPASVASGHSPSRNKKTEPGSNPRLSKSESLRIFSSSQMQGCLDRRNSMSSYDRSASCKNVLLSKQPSEQTVEPITPGWLPKQTSSNLMHSHLSKSESLRIFSSSQMQGFSDRRNSMSSYDRSASCKNVLLSKQPSEQTVEPITPGWLPKQTSSNLVHSHLSKSESLRIFSSSQMQGCSDRRNSMSSYDRSASCKNSLMSKQPSEQLVEPITLGWIPKKRSSNLMHSRLSKSEIFSSSQMQGCLDRRNPMSSYDRSASCKNSLLSKQPSEQLVKPITPGWHPKKRSSNLMHSRLNKSEIFSPSQMQGCLDRGNPMSSYDRSASCKNFLLSKQPSEQLVEPITPGWLPKKRSSNLMHSQPATMGEDVTCKIVVTEETEVGEGQVDYMYCDRRQTEKSFPNEKIDRKRGACTVEGYSSTSSIQTFANSSGNKMLCPSNVEEYNNHLGCSKQGFLRPVDTNCGLHRFVRSESNMDASKEKLNKKKGAPQRKENRDTNREDETGETNQITKNSSRFLGRSCSFRPEKFNNSTVKLPFFKNAKEWMKAQRSPSTINR